MPFAADRRVFVGKLDREDPAYIRQLFERFGPIEDVKFLQDAGDSRGSNGTA